MKYNGFFITSFISILLRNDDVRAVCRYCNKPDNSKERGDLQEIKLFFHNTQKELDSSYLQVANSIVDQPSVFKSSLEKYRAIRSFIPIKSEYLDVFVEEDIDNILYTIIHKSVSIIQSKNPNLMFKKICNNLIDFSKSISAEGRSTRESTSLFSIFAARAIEHY